jgi:hypothetical protein
MTLKIDTYFKMPPKKSECPVGKIRNPATGRCVSVSGKLGKELVLAQMKAGLDLSNTPKDVLEQILIHLSPTELFRIYNEPTTNRHVIETVLMRKAKETKIIDITSIITQIVMFYTKPFIKSINQNTFLYKYVRALIRSLDAQLPQDPQQPQVLVRYFAKLLCFYVVMMIEFAHNVSASGRLETIHVKNWYYDEPYNPMKEIYELQLIPNSPDVILNTLYILRRNGSRANEHPFQYTIPKTLQECESISNIFFSNKFIVHGSLRTAHYLHYDLTTPIFENCRPGAKRWFETLEKALVEDVPGIRFPKFST